MKKYRNKKVTIDGVQFDSIKEGNRYKHLKLMVKAGEISDLRLQVKYVLAPAVKINGRMKPELRYFADFVYIENGTEIVEDTKGVRTSVYRIKQHLMKSIHNIEILET